MVRALALAFTLICAMSQWVGAYSVLTHEAIIDAAWEHELKPLLLKRFPNTPQEQLIEAHAFAYGGAIIQDIGYYPLGNKLVSDLAHYVRSGDFVINLLREAQDANELAFALGGLAHYAADNNGHPLGVNRVVPMLYPKLHTKFGNEVTYEDDPDAHLKVEFGFDVLEVAHGHYAPQGYHDFIGFKVSRPLLERAFEKTYSIPLKDVLNHLDLALGTYRHTVSSIIPEMTKAAWASKKDDIRKSIPGVTRRKFIYNISRASYEKEWNKTYDRPGICARILAWLFRLLPKVGPLRAFAFRVPTPQAEKLLIESFNKTMDQFRRLVAEESANHLRLGNENFDTGRPTREGEYALADQTYSKLLEKLAEEKTIASPELRANILAFYARTPPTLPEKARQQLEALKAENE